MFLRLVFLSALFIPFASFSQETTILLKGEKQQVLAVIKTAMDAEISNGQSVLPTGGQGYILNYRSFFSGPSSVAAFITPMAYQDEWVVSSYLVKFSYRSTSMSNRGVVVDVIAGIKKLTQLSVEIVNDRTDYRPLNEQADRCANKFGTDSKLELLKTKVNIFGSDASLVQLSDDTKPSEEERRLIATWAAMRDVCVSLVKLDMSFYAANPLMTQRLQSFANQESLILALYQGKLTYGEFNTKRKQNAVLNDQSMIATTIEINKQNELAAAQNAEKQAAFELEKQRVLAEQIKAQALQTQANKPAPAPAPTPSFSCRTNNTGLGSSTTYCN